MPNRYYDLHKQVLREAAKWMFSQANVARNGTFSPSL